MVMVFISLLITQLFHSQESNALIPVCLLMEDESVTTSQLG